MQAILSQKKCIEALKGEASIAAHLTKIEKTEIVDKARGVIILCLGDKVLREFSMEYIMA